MKNYRVRSQGPKPKGFCPHMSWSPTLWNLEVFWFPNAEASEKKGPRGCPGFLWRLIMYR